MPEIRFVVFHKPGARWEHGRAMLEQEGLQAHVDHYRSLKAAGRLSVGGPFADAASGGMMITQPGLSFDDVDGFAAADPCVKSGLLRYEIRPWIQAMQA